MKILILTTSNPYKIAGVVALDLYKGLSALNKHEVKILVKSWDKFPDKNIISLESYLDHRFTWILRKSRKLLVKLKLIKPTKNKTNSDYSVQDYDQTFTYYPTKKILKKLDFKPDVIIVLFMQNFLSFKNIYELNKITKASIFLYMMDMAPFTGGCHYAWKCREYQKRCGNCPALYSEKESDQSRHNWEFKKKYIVKTEITCIAASEYQYRQLVQSSLFKEKPTGKIHISIDENIFKPDDNENNRRYFQLPTKDKIIFIGASRVTDKRKGIIELTNTLKIIEKLLDKVSTIHLAIAGKVTDDFCKKLPFAYTLLGHLSYSQLAIAFNASDLFLCPSIEDSGPMMINQSIMCGTPVVAFEMGVAIDLVITGETGYRAKLKDSKDLANGIKYIMGLEAQEYKKMSENCRKLGLELCHPQKQANKFIELLTSI